MAQCALRPRVRMASGSCAAFAWWTKQNTLSRIYSVSVKCWDAALSLSVPLATLWDTVIRRAVLKVRETKMLLASCSVLEKISQNIYLKLYWTSLRTRAVRGFSHADSTYIGAWEKPVAPPPPPPCFVEFLLLLQFTRGQNLGHRAKKVVSDSPG